MNKIALSFILYSNKVIWQHYNKLITDMIVKIIYNRIHYMSMGDMNLITN